MVQRMLTDSSCEHHHTTNVKPAVQCDEIERRHTDPSVIEHVGEARGEQEIGEGDRRRRAAVMRYPLGWQPAAFRLQGCPWYGQGTW